MSCTVAMSGSPVFSPSSRVSSSLFCKTSTNSCTNTSPETLKNPSSPSGFRVLRLQKPPPSPSSLIKASGDFKESSSTPPTVLKRKRPARLDIPLALSSSINFPVTPCAVSDALEATGDGFAVVCKKGRREAMEDRYSATVNLHSDSKLACFGVFDGHGGAKAAEFAAENLTKNIINEIESNTNNNGIEEAVKIGYLKTDSDFLKEDVWGGSCSVTALIKNGNLVVSNAGDCRAVVSKGGVAEALTSDHRPSRQDEKARIEALGGFVDHCKGIWRVHGSLAVSRGFGDKYLKQWVIAEPETRVLALDSKLEFLILASDGLWDKVINQEAVDIARPLCFGSSNPQLFLACKKLIDLAISRGSADDISVLVVDLGPFC